MSGQKLCLTILIAAWLWWQAGSVVFAVEGYRYAGLEYFGSSQMTTTEVEKTLGLRPGASAKAVESGVAKLEAKIEKLRLSANVQIVVENPDKLFVVLDFEERAGDGVPARALKDPHNVILKSDKPNMLLEKLHQRLQRLDEEGRQCQESYPGGVRIYSDEPASQIVVELRRYGPVLRDQWLEIVESDPNPDKRCEAIELLNWSGHTDDTCARLIGALDDSSYKVRASVIKFIFPRLEQLPDNFPYGLLADALVRQLKRPSHEDRSKALVLLLAIVRKQPMITKPLKEACFADVEHLSQESKIAAVRKAADDLLALFSGPMPKPPPVKVPESNF